MRKEIIDVLNKKLKIGLVGLRFGGEFPPIYRDHPDVESVTLCELNKDMLREYARKFSFQNTVDSFDALCESDVDAIHIVTGIPNHAELVIKALEEATGGETFISKIPSFKVTDLAKAMLPDCKMPEIGIRPGEKLHEIMVTVEDSATTYEYDKHFIVYPQVIWNDKQKINLSGKKVEEGFSYSSGNNTEWLSVEQIRELLKTVDLEK